jgi:hypothetical protein
MRTGNYILKGHTPVLEPDLLKWAAWFETGDRIVAKTEVGASIISTVFLGIDHQFGAGPPILFETMIFTDGGNEDFQRRYQTWAEAESDHWVLVAECRARSGG